jgi:hypothetical protein
MQLCVDTNSQTNKTTTFKSSANKYIYESVIPSLLSFLKLNIDHTINDDLLMRIAKVTVDAYENAHEVVQYKKNVYDLLSYMYNNTPFSTFLSEVDNPIQDIVDDFNEDATNKYSSRNRYTTFVSRANLRSKAPLYHAKVT